MLYSIKIMTQKIINIILFFLAINCAYSQKNIDGLVKDINNEPIPFAYISLTNSKGEINTQTDFDGKFKLNQLQSEKITISVSYAGYYKYDSIIKIDSTTHLTIVLRPDTATKYEILLSSFNRQGAITDIEKGEIKLLLPGGIAGSPRLPNDKFFEEKYTLSFLSQGCVRFPEENETQYNYVVFKYLDEKYGTDWRDEVRKDVIGLKN